VRKRVPRQRARRPPQRIRSSHRAARQAARLVAVAADYKRTITGDS
jgi:hypothetical protein